MKIIFICLISFYFNCVYNQDDSIDENRIKKIMDDYKLHPIYKKVKEEFYKKYGRKEFSVIQKISYLREKLKNVYEFTRRHDIPENLIVILRTTLNYLRSDLGKIDHSKTTLRTFNLTDDEAASYIQMYKEAKTLFSALDKKFKIEADC